MCGKEKLFDPEDNQELEQTDQGDCAIYMLVGLQRSTG